MKKSLYQYLIVRILLAWLVVVVAPAGILFHEFITANHWQITQINSILIASGATVLLLILLDCFTKFPGQKSMGMIFPVVFSVSMLAGLLLLIFRIEYSVYYLATAFVLAVLFCFVSQAYLSVVSKPVIAFVPIGRALALTDIRDVTWMELPKTFSPMTTGGVPFHAVVADLSDRTLDADWERLLAEISLSGIPVYNVLQVQESLTGRSPIKHLYENDLGSLLPSATYLAVKRIWDIAAIIISLPVVFPVSCFVALGILIESRGSKCSIFFTQKRVAQGGRLFTMYKFRSMIPTSEAQGAQMATVNDMRITKFGQFIRKMRLDELPQFINVLKGDMSLIGPRPEQPSFVEQFNETIPFYRYRHIVKPGITGWAQVMQGYAGDEAETKVKLEYDFYYIKNFSFTLDLLIVIKTIRTILTGFGAR